VNAPLDVLAVLREVGAELAPDRHACACHHVVDALCPARPLRRPGFASITGNLDRIAVARLIDHTVLKPEATPDDIRRLCREARENAFVAVCVNPVWVRLCAGELAGTHTVVATVAGFPLGASRADVKANEAAQGIGDGAREIDMVLNVGALRAGDLRAVDQDVRAVADACGALGAVLKVIIEAALLTDREKVVACAISKLAGADFVKTSTGFGPGGATAADVALMRSAVGEGIGVKAAGGVRSWAAAQAMIAAGASRIGTSSGAAILGELEATS
jgi:deoxyribose-phosphate aldolase